MLRWQPYLLLNPLVDLTQTNSVAFIFYDSIHGLLLLLHLDLISEHLPQPTSHHVLWLLVCIDLVLL